MGFASPVARRGAQAVVGSGEDVGVEHYDGVWRRENGIGYFGSEFEGYGAYLGEVIAVVAIVAEVCAEIAPAA